MTLAVALSPIAPACADETKPTPLYESRVETRLRVSKDRTVNVTEIWRPLTQNPDRLFYGSLRSLADNNENFEGNLGLGWRGFYDDHIWGGYGFVDRRRTAFGSQFWQMNAGLEYMRENWDARVNLYLPTDPVRHHATDEGIAPIIAGNGVYIRGPGDVVEEAQKGGEVEVGFKLPDLTNFTANTRLFGAVYHFDGRETPDVTGARVRLQADVASWLQLGVRAQYDEERGAQYFAEAVFRLPGRGKSETRANLWNRMSDTPERDIDIVTGEKSTPGALEPFIDNQTGQQARFIFVDNRVQPGGNGTAENPYATIADAMAAAQSYDTVYVAAGDGTTHGYDGNIALNMDHITLQGSGSALLLDGSRYGTDRLSWEGQMVVRPAGDYPLLTNSMGDILTITADDIAVRGLYFDGAAGSGIVIEGAADNVVLDNLRLTGNGNDGLLIQHTQGQDMTVTMRDTVVSGNLLYGVLAEDMGAGLLELDFGTDTSYGGNDLAGNLTQDMYVNAVGGTLSAGGNYWGATGTPNILGPQAAAVYTGAIATNPFCNDCSITSPDHFDDVSGLTAGQSYTTPIMTLAGFTGTRWIMVDPMDGQGAPDFLLNGAPVGGRYMRVQSGDQIAVRASANVNSGYARFMHIYGGGMDTTFMMMTQ